MKITIPTVGQEIVLTKDWTFDMILIHDNRKAYEAMTGSKMTATWKGHDPGYKDMAFQYDREKMTLPIGTRMKPTRMSFQRNTNYGSGVKDYDSMTFHVKRPGDRTGFRVFVDKENAFKMDFDFVTDVIKAQP